MRDNWWNHNTDKVMLFVLVVLLAFITIHIAHHDAQDMQAVTWAEGAFSTVLGALILILTGRVNRSDGQTANGLSPSSPPAISNPSDLPKSEV